MIDIEKERAAFEACHGGIYRGHQEDIAWAAWQARAATQPAPIPAPTDEKHLRKLLALIYTKPGMLYVDDGELQDNSTLPFIDFLRDAPVEIETKMRDRTLARHDLARRCKKCRAPRKGETCHKCGGPTFSPCAGWEEPELPPVDRIRELAREVGYAVGVHGTLERDLDLIAAPWVETAIGNAAFFDHIAKGLGARVVEMERKPLGRYAVTIQMDGAYKPIDLSVCPFGAGPALTDEAKDVSEARVRLEQKWDSEGDCRSCGWHALLCEHDVDDDEIAHALADNHGWLELSCISKDDEDSDSHRGVRIQIGPNASHINAGQAGKEQE